MENFHELLKNRRSIRKYTEELLSSDDVKLILQAGLMAPSSKRTNGWEFVVVEDKAVLEELSQCKEFGSKLIAGAALAIVVLADPLKSDVWIEDASIASILMQLQAEDLGLGSCWVQIRERSGVNDKPADEYVRELLDIPLQMQVLSIIAIGKKAEARKPFDEEKLQWEKIHIGKW
ncbi:MAG TPA: nitroreductase family protein [Candidatus Gallibacteroides avistercoris]|uniref:Nitroreductase family protein n=1 Tax=Candidatus Gallibacteroides avistercoris TaxID=2840833 RepID=A0A9D1M910_9BACT|nr:nitroreductase family protein [Candidatus Gallibacteroides avistercoris]